MRICHGTDRQAEEREARINEILDAAQTLIYTRATTR
jgi:hypothetical protein